MAVASYPAVSYTLTSISSRVKLPSTVPNFESFNPLITKRNLVPFTTTCSATANTKGSLGVRSQFRKANLSSGKVQEFSVYEINENDRDSPAYLRLIFKKVNSLGDIIPFTNKVYSGDIQMRLGITDGICFLIKHEEEKNGDRYEAIFSFYFGDYGHIAVQGPYLSYGDTYLAVTGGSGIFQGVRGQVKVENLVFPSKRFCTFYLKGIPDLPTEMRGTALPPFSTVEPTPAAKACEPEATLPNFTD